MEILEKNLRSTVKQGKRIMLDKLSIMHGQKYLHCFISGENNSGTATKSFNPTSPPPQLSQMDRFLTGLLKGSANKYSTGVAWHSQFNTHGYIGVRKHSFLKFQENYFLCSSSFQEFFEHFDNFRCSEKCESYFKLFISKYVYLKSV